jgi:hypothetical protein
MPEADVITEPIITCPSCGTAKTETMPTDACRYFYECTGCDIAAPQARRLLCVLFLWLRALSPCPGLE